MADIDVQRKKASPLPWIILIIVALALLAFFLIGKKDGELNRNTSPVTTDSTVTGIDTINR
jgi:hypothetical protein